MIRDLLVDYDKLPRPVQKDAQNVTVHFAASLMELLNHAESTGRVGMRMIMRLVSALNFFLSLFFFIKFFLNSSESDICQCCSTGLPAIVEL